MKKIIYIFALGILMIACTKEKMEIQVQNTYSQEQMKAAIDSTAKAEREKINWVTCTYVSNLMNVDSLEAALTVLMLQRLIYQPFAENFFTEGMIQDELGQKEASKVAFNRAYNLYKEVFQKNPYCGSGANVAICELILFGRERFDKAMNALIKTYPKEAEWLKGLSKVNYEELKKKVLKSGYTDIPSYK